MNQLFYNIIYAINAALNLKLNYYSAHLAVLFNVHVTIFGFCLKALVSNVSTAEVA